MIDHKLYDLLKDKYDPVYKEAVAAIDIVKVFIIEKGLIIYGGTALDYALRLVGDYIYPDDMLALPDLDFYSPDSVTHAYDLAQRLYNAGHTSTRVINAEHLRTIKVDIGAKHFIADISYVPSEVFSRIPTLVYNKMLIVTPQFQRIDIHSALAFPFDNPPREVIFARWRKDLCRFNKSAKYYPIKSGIPTTNKSNDTSRDKKFLTKFGDYVIGGIVAYNMLYREYERQCNAVKIKTRCKMILSSYYDVICEDIGLVATDDTTDIILNNSKHYEPLGSLIPERREVAWDGVLVNILSSRNRLIAINNVDGVKYAGVQYQLARLLSLSYVSGDINTTNIYIALYCNIIDMITHLEEIANTYPLKKDIIYVMPHFLSVDVYGSNNISLAREIQLNRVYVDLGEAKPIYIPSNYYPDKGRPPPIFNYDDSPYFSEHGREIVKPTVDNMVSVVTNDIKDASDVTETKDTK